MVLRLAEGVLRFLRPCSPLRQVQAAAAHVQRLKQNKQKNKVVLDFRGYLHLDLLYISSFLSRRNMALDTSDSNRLHHPP